MSHADALSRLPVSEIPHITPETGKVIHLINQLSSNIVMSEQIKN